MNTIINHPPLKTIADLLKALEQLEHVCSFDVVEGGVLKCECGKIVKKN